MLLLQNVKLRQPSLSQILTYRLISILMGITTRSSTQLLIKSSIQKILRIRFQFFIINLQQSMSSNDNKGDDSLYYHIFTCVAGSAYICTSEALYISASFFVRVFATRSFFFSVVFGYCYLSFSFFLLCHGVVGLMQTHEFEFSLVIFTSVLQIKYHLH